MKTTNTQEINKVIIRIENGSVIFGFPTETCSYGCINVFTANDGHNEVDSDYFASLKKPAPHYEAEIIPAMLEYYARVYNAPLTRVCRDSQAMRVNRWK